MHRCNLKILAKNRFEKSAISVKFQQKKLQMLQNLQNDAKFQKIKLDNLIDFEKCCKTRIYLEKSVPIQPKTSNILPKICQKFAKNEQHFANRGAFPIAVKDSAAPQAVGKSRRERPPGRAQLRALKRGHLGACSVRRNWYRSVNAA